MQHCEWCRGNREDPQNLVCNACMDAISQGRHMERLNLHAGPGLHEHSIIAAARTLATDWHRVPVAKQRELFGKALFGRSQIKRGLHGIHVRNRAGRDSNGMPRYTERVITYREMGAMR